jgi:signal transduction histidine kinase
MASGTRDVVGFRRIFVLFCTLVLLPAMLMSGFAIIAIFNERAADKNRQRELADGLLVDAETALLNVLEQTDRVARARLDNPGTAEERLARMRMAGLPVGPALLISPASDVTLAEPPFDGRQTEGALLRRRVAAALNELPAGASAHLDSGGEPRPGVVALLHTDAGWRMAFFLDEKVLGDRLAAATPAEDDLLVEFVPSVERAQVEVGAVERLLSDMVRVAEKDEAAARAGLATRRLDAPFQRYELRVEGLPRSGSATTIVYLVLLLVFYATLITGVVLTSRLVWREAKLSALKTDFVSHVSHELRTPLTSIRMFIETLERGRASEEEQQECLDLLSRETERLSEMIERVLGYARLRSGRRQFSIETIDAKALVDDALEAFRAHRLGDGASADALELVTEVDADLPPLLADRDASVEALVNLLGNAYKYTGSEKVIRIFARPGRRGRVALGVEDNGPGLPRSEHKRVFERFYQAGSLLARKSSGSGLGLAITKGIVEGQGGRIHVESEPGKGATFIIELPVAETVAQAA